LVSTPIFFDARFSETSKILGVISQASAAQAASRDWQLALTLLQSMRHDGLDVPSIAINVALAVIPASEVGMDPGADWSWMYQWLVMINDD